MKTILAAMVAVLLGLSFAGSAYAAEQTPSVSPSSTSLLSKGDRVQIKKGSIALNVLDSISGNFLGQQPELAMGIVTGSPQSDGKFNWVYVDYDNGVDGWSTDRSLMKVDALSSPALAPVSTLTAAYVGVTGEDKVGTTKIVPNGKADHHISVSGLRSTPTKVTITNGVGGTWETPYNGSNWLVATQFWGLFYNSGGSGDFWFEPYNTVVTFHVKVTYADGSTDEADATNAQTVTPPCGTACNPQPLPPSTLQASYVGVTGEDKVGTITVTPNGKADHHISVSGLRSIPTKVIITNGVGGTWITPHDSTYWLVATQYNGTSGDFWFEPYNTVVTFHVKVTYADGSTDEADATNQVPPTAIPMHPPMTATLLGQTGEDVIGTRSLGRNGVPDVHVRLSGVSGTISNIRITAKDGTWEMPLNPRGIWLVTAVPTADPSVVDVFFDYYKSITTYTLAITYTDGQSQSMDTTPSGTAAPTPPTPTPTPTPPTSSTGNTYYVSSGMGAGAQTAGDDGNPGTLAQPFKTLQKAIPLLNPGYTLIVRGGEYDTVNGLTKSDGSGNSIIPSGLSWDQPVTIKAYPGEKPVFRRYLPPDFPYTEAQLQTSFGAHMPTLDECAAEAKRVGVALNFPWGCFSSTGSGLAPGELPPFVNAWQGGYVLNMSNDAAHLVQYIIFDGIDFDARGIIQGLLTFYDGARHLRFQNLEVRNSVHSCVSNPGGDPSVQLDHQWLNMKVHHCGMPYDTNLVNGSPAREHPAARFFQSWYMHSGGVLWDGIEVYKVAGAHISPLGNNNIIRNSYFHDNNAMGLICAGNWELYNNVFVTSYGEAAWTYGCKFRNNTFVGKPGSMVGILIKEQAVGDLFENNILIGYNYGITSGQTAGTPAIARNNLIVSGNAAREIYEYENSVVRITRQNNILGQDPLFVNPAAGDYRLQAGSPAINAGFANGLASDFGGFARDSQPDIGAYEFGN